MTWLKKHNISKYGYGTYNIFYSPIGRCYVLATQEQYENFLSNGQHGEIFGKLTDYVPIARQRKVRVPKDYTLLTVLPNNICNFTCSYCYSARARNGAQLSESCLKTAIDFFFESKEDGFAKPLTISFMGGGEPMLSWDVVSKGVDYAQMIARQRKFRLNVRVITNGSILKDEQLSFFKKNGIEVSVSFEILEDIQNQQRKHYDIVFANIQRLLAFGIPVQINSTITPGNVSRMIEMVNLLHAQFPSIKNAMFEPVVSETLFETPEVMSAFYVSYVKEFISARRLADKYEIGLTSFAYLRTVFPLERACPGEFCLTAEGDITGCYCIVNEDDSLFPQTKYGTTKDGKMSFEMEQFERLVNNNVYSKEECGDCEVRWNCGGGCFHQYNSYSKLYRDEVCRFTKSFVESVVIYKVDKWWHNHHSEEILQSPIYFKEEI